MPQKGGKKKKSAIKILHIFIAFLALKEKKGGVIWRIVMK